MKPAVYAPFVLASLIAGTASLGVAAAPTQVAAPPVGHAGLDRPFRILVERFGPEGARSVTVYSDGVGFWRNERQFKVPPAAIETILSTLETSGFKTMPDLIGAGPRRIRSRVWVDSPSLKKEAAQLMNGEQSKALDQLTAGILDLAEPLARVGVTPTSLEDGLAKVGRGELAAAALTLVVQRQPELSHPKGPGWLLTVEHAEGSLQESVDRRRGELRHLNLQPEAVRRLAEKLHDSGFAGWPANLYSKEYVQLIVQVLRWRKVVEARAFTSLSAASHAVEQKSLDDLLAALETWRQGVSTAAPGP